MTHQRAGENGQQGDWPRIEKGKHGEEDNTLCKGQFKRLK